MNQEIVSFLSLTIKPTSPPNNRRNQSHTTSPARETCENRTTTSDMLQKRSNPYLHLAVVIILFYKFWEGGWIPASFYYFINNRRNQKLTRGLAGGGWIPAYATLPKQYRTKLNDCASIIIQKKKSQKKGLHQEPNIRS